MKIYDLMQNYIFSITMGFLVGSAEQGFVSLDRLKVLGRGNFMSCTPCFRREDVHDILHRPYFMKVELYKNDVVDESALSEMISHAYEFFSLAASPKVVKTSEGFDIEINNIEVGSYGLRKYNNLQWVYGTGVALPRYSTAKERNIND